MEERLQKILSSYGYGARRKCEEFIINGQVKVNGETAILGQKADADIDEITIDGKPIKSANTRNVYVLLHKPAGYVCTKEDIHAEKTIMELVKDVPFPLHPVGRLDKNTKGLILLTNDGNFTNIVTHPSFSINKKYLALIQGKISRADIETLEKGIELYGKKTSPCKINMRGYNKTKDMSTCEVIIHEGKKRQVRKMFASIEKPVKSLTRIELGPLTLKGVKEGTYRYLSMDEVRLVKTPGSVPKTKDIF